MKSFLKMKAYFKSDESLCTDKATRLAYAFDASIFQCEPLGVFFPKEETQLQNFVRLANEFQIPLLPRGAGSSLSGQAVTGGVIVDLSAWQKIELLEGKVRVQPGVIIDEIDKKAAEQKKRFGPAPASSNRATIGGLLANNGTGARSILYGMACDQLEEARVLLPTGEIRTFARGDLDRNDGFTKQILAITGAIKDSPSWPKTWRNASGLNIGKIYSQNSLLPLFCGSEGRLGIILEAKVRLVLKPEKSFLGLFFYSSLREAMEDVPRLLKTQPSAVELMDRHILEMAEKTPLFERSLLGETLPEATLIVEYENQENYEEVRSWGAQKILATKLAQDQIWKMRKAGLGILMSTRGKRKPIPFIEDCAVPVDQLPEYVEGLEKILKEEDTFGAFYAHASAGCLHIRPLLDLDTALDQNRMANIMKKCIPLLKELGGTLSGEHGDGRTKGPYLEELLGKDLIIAFDKIQKIFDPEGIFRPYGQAQLRKRPPKNHWKRLSWPQGFSAEIAQCNGEGACRKKTGMMCPSFQATGNELLSTRGRANLLRAFLAGENVTTALKTSLSQCLACKACSQECSSQVDMALLKAEYTYQQGCTWQDHFFARFSQLSRLGNLFPSQKIPFPQIIKKTVGIDSRCDLPQLSKKSFSQQYQAHKKYHSNPDAFLFIDTHTEFYEPEIAWAALKICHHLKLSLQPLFLGCCARPAFSRGVLDLAQKQINKLSFPKTNQPILVIEPSCLSMLKEDALRLDPSPQNWTPRIQSIESYLLPKLQSSPPKNTSLQTILYHCHCHAKTAGLANTGKDLLACIAPVQETDAGCCGMAGSFGYEKKNYDLAMKIAQDRFFPALTQHKGEIALNGRSCREMAMRIGEKGRHPLEIIADYL